MSMQDNASLSLFAELLAIPAPTGREGQMATHLFDQLESYGYQPAVDSAGNVFVSVAGTQAEFGTVCIAAHMDEIGMVVTDVGADGSLSVDRSGGLYPWKLGEGPVDVLGDRTTISGVLSMGSTHSPDADDKAITWSRTRILTGLPQSELSAAGVRPGSTAVPARSRRGPVIFGPKADPLVGAWTFDDRMGIVALLRLLQAIQERNLSPVRPLVVAFTVHEEGGGHGAKVLAQRLQPEIFIAIDGCPIPDGAPLELDGRPGIWSKDRLAHYDQRLVTQLMRCAQHAGTELQPVVYNGAASDASLVYSVGGVQRIACFGQVRENSHGYEVARLSVFDNILGTLLEYISDDSAS